MRKKHLYLQNYKKETPLFLLGKNLIKLLLGCQKLCQKNLIKPFAPLTMKFFFLCLLKSLQDFNNIVLQGRVLKAEVLKAYCVLCEAFFGLYT